MSERFRLGINYWPARSAMAWWKRFERSEVAADFARIFASGFDSVRLFLIWEDFQPTPERVESRMVERLSVVMDVAHEAGLGVMPTLFTGHMSGVNFIPAWALGGSAGDERFRVVSDRAVTVGGLRNWYTDPIVFRAQALLAGELAGALRGHEALWAWDLGNENSNCVIPPSKDAARDWLSRITGAIRKADDSAKITLGIHMEDLEQDRHLGPSEAAAVCDFLTMHGYPGYAAWARSATDERLLPFLAEVTRWLSGGAEILFSEFGVPTYRRGDARVVASTTLVEEQEAAGYVDRALRALLECGCTGAMLWCYADYAREIWGEPPLDVAIHERSFGLWRADGSSKPALAAVEGFANAICCEPGQAQRWIDIETREFYLAPSSHLPRLYRRYCESESPSSA